MTDIVNRATIDRWRSAREELKAGTITLPFAPEKARRHGRGQEGDMVDQVVVVGKPRRGNRQVTLKGYG